MSWRPLGVSRRYSSRPSVGDVVAIDHRAWEVTHVIDAIPTAEEEARLNAYRAEYREKHLPYKVSLKRLHGPRHENENSRAEVGYRVPVGAFGAFPQYKDGRVPLCSCHGHPWPCLEAEQQRYAEAELAKAEKALRVLPGCCPACGEVVTHRQKSITFGGPNVSNPLAEGPTYHLRRRCRQGAAEYEEKWVNDEPGRKRSLLTLWCEGTLIVHGDGSGECFGAQGQECPSVYARHRAHVACYYQTHGCGRECSRAGHPGTRLAGRPDDPRAVLR